MGLSGGAVSRTFFTYVWGPPGDPAWPLTFSSKNARTQALKALAPGDSVYIVGTMGEPTRPEHKGRVVGVFQVSGLEVDTRDYAYLGPKERHPDFDNVLRFPFALHPIAAWEVTTTDNVFSKLVGPLTGAHHLRAQTTVVELDLLTAEPLHTLERRPLRLAQPRSEFTKSLIQTAPSKLAPPHSGSFEGIFKGHETWYVYALALTSSTGKTLALKVGYSSDPKSREEVYNHGMATELTGFRWRLAARQATTSEEAARTIEQALFVRFAGQRLASNGEILRGVSPEDVLSATTSIMLEMTSQKASG